MGTYQREKSKFLVSVLDMKAFAKNTMLYLIGNGYEFNGNERIDTHYPLGIVTAKNGKRYIIDEDGCGEDGALEDERQRVAWYKRTLDNKGNVVSFQMFPFVEVTYEKSEIDAIPVTSVVTLDKFIRVSGGARLERLFGNWTKFLETGIVPEF